MKNLSKEAKILQDHFLNQDKNMYNGAVAMNENIKGLEVADNRFKAFRELIDKGIIKNRGCDWGVYELA